MGFRSILFVGLMPMMLVGCESKDDLNGDGEYTGIDRIYEDYGDEEISLNEEVILGEWLKNYTEDVEGVYIEDYEVVDIQESPRNRKDEEGNTYKKIYIVEIAFKLDGDATRHGSRLTVSLDNSLGEEVILVYGSSLGNNPVYTKTEFIEEDDSSSEDGDTSEDVHSEE